MADKMIENNQVVIMGEIVSPFTFSHQVFGEGFYLVDVMVKRLSESQTEAWRKSTAVSSPSCAAEPSLPGSSPS